MRLSHRLTLVLCFLGGVALLATFGVVSPAHAHADLIASDPPAGAILATPPETIRLFFSEPLEPAFSAFTVRGTDGKPLSTQSDLVLGDAKQLSMTPGELPEDVYTVQWTVVSTADGHTTQGNFIFSIGVALPQQDDVAANTAAFPLEGGVIRALNLLGAAMLLGGAGFLAWIGRDFPIVRRYLVAGWWVGGVSAILMLVHHTAQVAGVPLISAVRTPELGIVLLNTRFGALWWVRGLAWAAAGVILWRRGAIPLAGAVGGGGIILASGLYSHSTAMHDAFPAVINTLVHGLCAALWVGGLGAFLLTIGGLRRRENYGVFTLATITGRFSNYARIAVGGVALSGLYAGWLHVGTGDALLGTEYGRALLIKSLLLLPAFLVAGVNLILTGRALRGGSVLWAGRLRMLVGAEVALTAGVLVAVGVMTALQPARAAYAESIRRTALTETTVFREETMVEDGTHIRLEITPNRVGLNTFRVSLWSMVTLENIPNAARVFLRFRHSTKDLQRTELELANEGNGWYGAVGGNMSLPGTWHVRVTVKQAEKFDLLWDFTPTPRVQPPPFDPAAPLAGGMILRWLVGIAALILGGMAIAGGRGNLSGLVFAVILITLGGAMLIGIAL